MQVARAKNPNRVSCDSDIYVKIQHRKNSTVMLAARVQKYDNCLGRCLLLYIFEKNIRAEFKRHFSSSKLNLILLCPVLHCLPIENSIFYLLINQELVIKLMPGLTKRCLVCFLPPTKSLSY